MEDPHFVGITLHFEVRFKIEIFADNLGIKSASVKIAG